jgi:hypothetical protein
MARPTRLEHLVRELREMTGQQKDAWLKYTSGNRAALDPSASRRWCCRARGEAAQRGAHQVFARLAEWRRPQGQGDPAVRAQRWSGDRAAVPRIGAGELLGWAPIFAPGEDRGRAPEERHGGKALPPMDAIEGGSSTR